MFFFAELGKLNEYKKNQWFFWGNKFQKGRKRGKFMFNYDFFPENILDHNS